MAVPEVTDAVEQVARHCHGLPLTVHAVAQIARCRSLDPASLAVLIADDPTRWEQVSAAAPRLVDRKVVYESNSPACNIEAQDFYENDRKMTFTCYEPGGMASVMSIDLASGAAANMSKAPGTYNECEGIFPGGEYTCVEGDRQVQQLGSKGGFRQIDIWKLKLDGTGKDFTRLTYFNDYEGWKASNPVIATDGSFMAFQVAHTGDEAGVGYGILRYRFK